MSVVSRNSRYRAGAELDLRDSKLHPDGADLDLAVAFAGMEITVPDSWVVRVTGLPIFGGIEVHN